MTEQSVAYDDWRDDAHPLVVESYANLHWRVESLGELGVMTTSLPAYRYNNAVVSLCFHWFDQGLPPFLSDCVEALRELDIPTYKGTSWTVDHLYHVMARRYLHEEMCHYRHRGNLAYVTRLNQRDKRSVWQHYVCPQAAD